MSQRDRKMTPDELEAYAAAHVGGGAFDEEPYELNTLRLLIRDLGSLPQRPAEWLLAEYPKREQEVIALQSECLDRQEENERLSCTLEACRARIRGLEREMERRTERGEWTERGEGTERERTESAAGETC